MPDAADAWTRLSVGTAQVLICDLQPEIVARCKTTEPDALRRSAGVLVRLAGLFDLPTTLSVVPEGGRPPELIEELRGHEFAEVLPRMPFDPFHDPATDARLRAADRPVLILAGVAMEAVVLHAGMSARAAGYEVLVPVDACGGMSAATEAATLRQLDAAGAVATSVVSIGTKLAPDVSTETGARMFAILQDLRLA